MLEQDTNYTLNEFIVEAELPSDLFELVNGVTTIPPNAVSEFRSINGYYKEDQKTVATTVEQHPDVSSSYTALMLINHPIPEHFKRLPAVENFNETGVNFQIQQPESARNRSSPRDPTLYMKLDTPYTFTALFETSPNNAAYKIRAMLVYNNPNLSIPFNRCPKHLSTDSSKDEALKNHVLRCTDEEAEYTGSREETSFGGRLSVLIPMGTSSEKEMTFQFVCLSSCGGIGRSTSIIFTLEDQNCNILARQTFEVRVASNIGRDMKLAKDKSNGEQRGIQRKATRSMGEEPPRKRARRTPVQSQSQSVGLINSEEYSEAPTCDDNELVQLTLKVPRFIAGAMLDAAVVPFETGVMLLSSKSKRNQLILCASNIRLMKASLQSPTNQSSDDSS